MFYSNLSNITQKWLYLLLPFTTNYGLKISGSELARKTGIPQQTASRILKDLIKKNILEYQLIGKNKQYYLKKEKKKELIILLETIKSLELQQSKISPLLNELKQEFETIIVFGSYANNKATKDSDLDVVIIKKNKQRDEKTLNKLKETTILKINEHFSTYKELRKLVKKEQALALEIKNNHVIIGNVSRVIEIFK